jgi:DNA-binding response OmpR family regulator
VVVADDDPDILLLITVTLERDGYDVVTAKDGLSALEAAVERVPHLVVLDLMMPGSTATESRAAFAASRSRGTS